MFDTMLKHLGAGLLVAGVCLAHAYAADYPTPVEGDYIAKGFNVDLGTAAAPSTNHAMWYLNFSKQNERNAPLSIVIDANTGKVEKVIKE